jgi:hypothetical protein
MRLEWGDKWEARDCRVQPESVSALQSAVLRTLGSQLMSYSGS